ITPAHDFNDFQVGNRHKLPRINILNPDGTLNENAGVYQGLDRLAARKKIVEDLETQGLLLKVEPHEHNVGHCYRCATVVEPYYSKQWFVKMKPLAQTALQAVAKGETKFIPEMWRSEYERWLGQIQDWCISRQIWWGHRIPVYTCKACSNQMASDGEPKACERCGKHEFEQDPDVLDTWFSSALWPFSTLGWPDTTKELERFYPTSVLVTSWDILFFWVARMMMMGLKFMERVPFEQVYIYSLVADEEGKKMSKSKGNVVDPLDMIEKYGTDALRFTLTSIETRQRYVSLTPDRLESSRNFVNKLYNATRFLLMAMGEGAEPPPFDFKKTPLTRLEDRWIVTRLSQVLEEAGRYYEDYKVAELSQSLYRFLWNEVCDWYWEAIKPRLYASDEAVKQEAASLAIAVLDAVMRLLHPIMPFVTEELWHRLPGKRESLMLASWPEASEYPVDPKAVLDFEFLREVVTSIRTVRSELNVPPMTEIQVSFLDEKTFFEKLSGTEELLKKLCKVQAIGRAPSRPPKTALAVVGGGEAYIHLEGLIDLAAESARQEKEALKLVKYIQSVDGKLCNAQFIERAPVEVIEVEKKKLAEAREKESRIRKNLEFLKN
ncbi:MAG: valine--tRNA ligase, partial [bacterium]